MTFGFIPSTSAICLAVIDNDEFDAVKTSDRPPYVSFAMQFYAFRSKRITFRPLSTALAILETEQLSFDNVKYPFSSIFYKLRIISL